MSRPLCRIRGAAHTSPSLLPWSLLFVIWCLPASSPASLPLILNKGQESYQVGLHVEYLEDKERRWTIEQITSPPLSGQFVPSKKPVPNFGFSRSAFWLRFKVENRMGTGKQLLLELAYPMLDHLELYTARPDGSFSQTAMGEDLPHGGKVIRFSNFIFPIAVADGQQRWFYLRARSEGALQIPLTLWTMEKLREHESAIRIGRGLYYGFLIVMIFYHLLLSIATRHRSHLYFMAYAASVMGFLAPNDGIAQTFIWPTLTWWTHRVVPFSICCTCMFGLITTNDFLVLRLRHPRWNRVVIVAAIIAACGAFFSFFLPYNSVTAFATFWVIPSVSIVWTASVLSLIKGNRLARYFVVAWSIFLVGTFLLALSRLGAIPRTPLAELSWTAGFAFNVAFISIALADSINLIKLDKERAIGASLEAQRQAAATLEQEVNKKTVELQARTGELAAAYQRLAEQDRIKSNFFANVSHELRTPLTLILSPLERLLAGHGGTLSESTRQRLKSMAGNTQRLLRLVNQLLEFSRLESGGMTVSFQRVDVREFLSPILKAFSLFARSKSLKLELRVEQEPPEIYVDQDKLERVMHNLLSNACKFTPEGGRVLIHVAQEANWLCIAVRDSGIGISREALPRIFERFHQVDSGTARLYEGTGIGLALSKELVDLVGGKLKAESEPGFGSTFTVMLPMGTDHIGDGVLLTRGWEENASVNLARSKAAATALAAEMGVVDVKSRPEASAADDPALPLLVVVDDNPDLRGLVAEICKGAFRVLEAGDGHQGLELIQKHGPALVVADSMMPHMDGHEMMRQVRSNADTASTPVILLTAEFDEQKRLDILESGADDYLTKPFEPRELLARARNLVRLQQKERDLIELNEKLQQEIVSQSAKVERAKVLGKFLPPDVVRSVVERGSTGQGPQVSQREEQLTVFVLELRGLEEVLDAARGPEMAAIINSYLSEMMEVAFEHGATLDVFILERVSGFFGAPQSHGPDDDARRCAQMCLEMWRRAGEVCSRWADHLAVRPPAPTIALASGRALVGYIGSSHRLEYTALGGPADLAPKMLPLIPGGQLACCPSTWELIAGASLDGVDPNTKPQQLDGSLEVYPIAGISVAALDRDEEQPLAGRESVAARLSALDAVEAAMDETIDAGEPSALSSGLQVLTSRADLEIGDIIARRYRLTEYLGRGGMGSVYRATDIKLSTEVALKMLHPDLKQDTQRLKGLRREVRLTRLVSHPNIAQIFDIVDWMGTEFICMECIEGQSLEDRIMEGGALSLEEGMGILRQVCAGLGAIHAAGIVHRDIKPSNIMLAKDGRAVILDLGIARLRDPGQSGTSETMSGLMGTPFYMAPEQFEGEKIDPRADIYSLGIVTFEMFTGVKPFTANSAIAIAYLHVRKEPPHPLDLRPDMPPRLAEVILRCLEKKPEDRFWSVAEIGALL